MGKEAFAAYLENDDDSDIDLSDIPEIDFTGIESIRFNGKQVGIRSDKEVLLKCVEKIEQVTGKRMNHYQALTFDRWLSKFLGIYEQKAVEG